MGGVWHIAINTFRESVRDRVLYVIAFFALLLIAGSQGLGWVSVGEQTQIVAHFSLAVMSVFGALVAVFVGTGLIFKEIEKRTIYTILSKPVERWQFVIGKFVGLWAVMACVIAGMGAAAGGVVALSAWSTGAELPAGLYAAAVGMIALEMTVVTSLAILFSTVSSPILAAIFTFSAYLVGQVTRDLMALATMELPDAPVAEQTGERLTDAVASMHWWLQPASRLLYALLPNLEYFQLRNHVVYGPAPTGGEILLAILYAAGYSAAVLLLAVILFDRKRL